MRVTRALWQQRQPMIRFIGRRTAPQAAADHTPKPHPESSLDALPESFASYREKAIQHGPLKARQPSPSSSAPQSSTPSAASSNLNSAATSTSHPHGEIGGRSARELGPIRLNRGEVRDRSELPQRFHRTPWSAAEIEAIESGGASMFA